MAKRKKEDKKKVGLIGEFKKFVMRGNVIDLTVGVIIGGAFQKIVTSVVNDLIMPFVGLCLGGVNFNDAFVVLRTPDGIPATYESLEAAKEAGATVFAYGTFISIVVDFLIMALIVFLLIKGINTIAERSRKKEVEEEKAPTTKKCPFCKSEIAIEATRCPHCTSQLEE